MSKETIVYVGETHYEVAFHLRSSRSLRMSGAAAYLNAGESERLEVYHQLARQQSSYPDDDTLGSMSAKDLTATLLPRAVLDRFW